MVVQTTDLNPSPTQPIVSKSPQDFLRIFFENCASESSSQIRDPFNDRSSVRLHTCQHTGLMVKSKYSIMIRSCLCSSIICI